MSETSLERISKAVADLDQDSVETLVRELLNKKVDPSTIIEKGLVRGIKEIGRKYESGEFFLSELMYGANVFNSGYQLLEPLIKQAEDKGRKGVVVLGTVAGDIHSIGKDIVKAMLIAEGFTVHDLGVDVSVDAFTQAVRNFKPDIVGASALLTSSIHVQKDLIKRLNEEGLRNSVKVLVGGAATTEGWAKEIGADGWGPTAGDGVRRITELAYGAERQ